MFPALSLEKVMCEQFGLSFGEFGKLLCQDLCNLLMVVMTGTFQQRLISDILEQSVFKCIKCLKWPLLLAQQVDFD